VSGGRLNALQWRILAVLAVVEPPFTLTGGGALAGVHLHHRETRDLDLFWRSRDQLGDLADKVRAHLVADGLTVSSVETSPTFHRMQADDGRATTLIDLVAEPFAALLPPTQIQVDGNEIRVDTPREILASKLCALLSRSELRDLEDVRALVEAGCDLEQAIGDAAHKDGGFSPLTLAWIIRSLEVEPIAEALGWSKSSAKKLTRFHSRLMDRLVALGAPEF
jgi:hypothetical protein